MTGVLSGARSAGGTLRAHKRTDRWVARHTPRLLLATAAALGALLVPPVAQAAPQPNFTVSPSTNVTVGTWVQFDASSSVAAPDATYAWNFGNGDGDSAQEGAAGEDVQEPYNQAGTYTVTLTVSDSTGTASTSQTITVSSGPPTVTFLIGGLYPDEFDLPPPAPGASVTFQDQSQSNDGSALASFVWSFGDGATGRGDAVAHTYAQAGAYDVTETVTDSDGLSSQATQRLVIDAPPVASFHSSPAGQTVTFNAIGSHATVGAGTLADYTWSFGDGAEYDSGPDPVVAHHYSFPGSWSVTLTVTDAFGLDASYTATLDVPANVFLRPLGDTAPLLYTPATIEEGRQAGSDDSSGADGTRRTRAPRASGTCGSARDLRRRPPCDSSYRPEGSATSACAPDIANTRGCGSTTRASRPGDSARLAHTRTTTTASCAAGPFTSAARATRITHSVGPRGVPEPSSSRWRATGSGQLASVGNSDRDEPAHTPAAHTRGRYEARSSPTRTRDRHVAARSSHHRSTPCRRNRRSAASFVTSAPRYAMSGPSATAGA